MEEEINLIKSRIYSLIMIPQVHQYVVILEEAEGARLLPIWIGVNEGTSIALHMEKQKMPRPMTHDLLANILTALNVNVSRVVINDLKNNIYYATIDIKLDDKVYTIDARPSDSLSLSVRTNAPIYINAEIFDKCPIIQKPITDEEVKSFKTKLKNLKPEDFFKNIK